MNVRPLLSRAASAHAKVVRRLDTREDGRATAFAARVIVLSIPVCFYFNLEGTWDALLIEFNDHVTPLAEKADAYLRFLHTTPSCRWFVGIMCAALAFDALCLVVRLWRFRSSSASPQS